ncbi:nucleotide sugar dehydrogenase [Pontiella sulfatireligans]|uniref:UDP-N-acetyl-D-glucosamine 6-dehydrogenase n=1 Tax=Pontiella sulfatireligans TaxID=2750658 RepID=A0A6C2UFP1_9BACT|nr:nucleotide sugar dehydrogenase [Pontiella sulfatireligans]VGO18251.1 UDP-N-acetyl-D-glucosamine 6-dehydrogenase [Pontiella sulfatireligans]
MKTNNPQQTTVNFDLGNVQIGIIGLGYVGLPLAVEFGKKFPTIGFDINEARVDELKGGTDSTLECSTEELASAKHLAFTTDISKLQTANCYIVTVPTPVDNSNRPDLTPLIKASETVGKVISKGDVVIYESTVYPGATEEDCIPVVEKVSGLKYISSDPSPSPSDLCPPSSLRAVTLSEPEADLCAPEGAGFYAGYSPERINPGDKVRRLTNIVKITSGSTPETADYVDALYRSILTVETHKAPSIKVAEAAKVIENTQRDVNIALVNELAMIFNRIGIDTLDVLEAAGSKWNFLPFRPGLVGGHCIGVDPYYLSFKAQQAGYYPELISAQRRINDHMGQFVVDETVKLMLKKKITVNGAKVLVLGITFKENCPDVRNTRVVDIVHAFEGYGSDVTIYDPWASPEEVNREYGLTIRGQKTEISGQKFDCVVLAVAHDEFAAMSATDFKALCAEQNVIYDIKNVLPRELVDARL